MNLYNIGEFDILWNNIVIDGILNINNGWSKSLKLIKKSYCIFCKRGKIKFIVVLEIWWVGWIRE